MSNIIYGCGAVLPFWDTEADEFEPKRLVESVTNLKPLKYKESLSSVTFYGKVNIRRKLRPKTSKFSTFVDFDHDFSVDEDYVGPTLPEDLPTLGSPDKGELSLSTSGTDPINNVSALFYVALIFKDSDWLYKCFNSTNQNA